MNPDQEAAPDSEDGHGSLVLLVLLACVVGAGAGAIGTLFRILLEHADAWRDALIGWAHAAPVMGFVLVTAGCAAAVALAACLVRRYSPEASGSGIPHVEAVLRQDVPPAPLLVLPVKFIDVDYETLTQDFEAQARRLIDFLDLTWDPACLSFHESASGVRTFSRNQVRNPIYQSSVGRWQRYEKELEPLIAALGDMARP